MTVMKKNYTGSFRFQTRGIAQLLNTERNCVWHQEQREQEAEPRQRRSWMGGRQSIPQPSSETANQRQLKTHSMSLFLNLQI